MIYDENSNHAVKNPFFYRTHTKRMVDATRFKRQFAFPSFASKLIWDNLHNFIHIFISSSNNYNNNTIIIIIIIISNFWWIPEFLYIYNQNTITTFLYSLIDFTWFPSKLVLKLYLSWYALGKPYGWWFAFCQSNVRIHTKSYTLKWSSLISSYE